MVQKLFAACLLCNVLVACALARPMGGCQESHRSRSLDRLVRRSAAIASSLRNLRSVRERRYASTYPVWKTMHKIQERAMDISNMPPLPVPDKEQTTRDLDKEQAAVTKELRQKGFGEGFLESPVEESGSWLSEPVVFPEPTKHGEEKGSEAWRSEVAESWVPLDYEDSLVPSWGQYRERCNDDIVGHPCTWNSDCRGCRGLFHCSNNRCQAGAEPDLRFPGFR